MSDGSFKATMELVINGHSCEREVTVRYDYSPAGGDGWNEPRYEAGAFVYQVVTTVLLRGLRVQEVDLMPLLTKEVLEGLEAESCQHATDEREFQACEHADMERKERALGRI